MNRKSVMGGLGILLAFAPVGGRANAQNPSEGGGASSAARGPTMADFVKLQNEVRDQRQLIVQMLQSEQQRYEMILKLIRVQGASAGGELPRLPTLPAVAAAPAAGKAADDDDDAPEGDGGHAQADGAPASKERGRRNASLSGRVELRGGGAASDTYVFISDVKGSPVKGRTVEIKQEGKQFSPRLAVVQSGTSVVFPNLDSVYHNVFSNSPRNAFDLGSSRGGETPHAVRLTKTGVVEVFCNMHQKMSANILVVPSPLYAKVRADGTFRIDNVPLGSHRVIAWSPGAKSVEQKVSLTSGGSQVAFALDVDEHKAHLNKLGQAYGSYRE